MFDLYISGIYRGRFNTIAEISSYIHYYGIDTTTDWVEIRRVSQYE